MDSFSNIADMCKKHVTLLSWQTYHTPENLTEILVGEVGELSELCVWLTKKQILDNTRLYKSVKEELADVIIAVIFLYNSLHLDVNLETLIKSKLDIEEMKYPVKKYKGVSKYEMLQPASRARLKAKKIPNANINKRFKISDFQSMAWKNNIQRDWHSFYSPASLCLGIFEDVSKIFISFQRRTTKITNSFEKIVWAIPGILILALRLAEYLEIRDINDIVVGKLKSDYKRFKKISY